SGGHHFWRPKFLPGRFFKNLKRRRKLRGTNRHGYRLRRAKRVRQGTEKVAVATIFGGLSSCPGDFSKI
ncbi:hypothetical protein, partial [Salmonella enterica]|uniref:hypothetical protein n=1 Tax=Salmonella enterica TaxID=28901 RepID=UPI002E9EAA64|nr:hypothetical protein [Salmonella enterica subsp. enterica serovar Paratyphi A]